MKRKVLLEVETRLKGEIAAWVAQKAVWKFEEEHLSDDRIDFWRKELEEVNKRKEYLENALKMVDELEASNKAAIHLEKTLQKIIEAKHGDPPSDEFLKNK